MKRKSLRLLLLSLLFSSCGIPIKRSLRVYTVATVTELNSKKTEGRNSYFVSTIDYPTGCYHHLQGILDVPDSSLVGVKLCKGEKFILVYNKNDPSDYIVYSDKPVFLEDEPFVETVGTIERVSPLVLDDGVEFSYQVNESQSNEIKNKSYTKFQNVASTIGEKKMKKQFPNLKKGNKYVVRYSPDNPQRAVIYLDKLIQK